MSTFSIAFPASPLSRLRSSPPSRLIVAVAGVLLVIFGVLYLRTGPDPIVTSLLSDSHDRPWRGADLELGKNDDDRLIGLAHSYTLSESQCDRFFPHLFDDIEESILARESRNITVQELDNVDHDQKHTRVMIYDGEIFIINDYGKLPDERTTALLSALHRALTADPDRSTLPNIEFIMSRDDFCNPEPPLWCMTRYKPPANNFIMPDFGFWSWPISSVGSYTLVQRRIQDLETAKYPNFTSKIPKLIWRGSMDVDHDTRTRLLEASVGHDWSDVEPISWVDDKGEPQTPPNLIAIEDHCKYQFIAHSEGNTFSGRQKYIHNCNSVVIAHPLMWIQPFHRFLVSEGPDQNYVKVSKDYSDLAEKMQYYLANPEKAATIAANSVRTFRNRYLTPAAEACYWRKLVRGYARVAFEPLFYATSNNMHNHYEPRGTPYETYIVTGNLNGRPRRHWVD